MKNIQNMSYTKLIFATLALSLSALNVHAKKGELPRIPGTGDSPAKQIQNTRNNPLVGAGNKADDLVPTEAAAGGVGSIGHGNYGTSPVKAPSANGLALKDLGAMATPKSLAEANKQALNALVLNSKTASDPLRQELISSFDAFAESFAKKGKSIEDFISFIKANKIASDDAALLTLIRTELAEPSSKVTAKTDINGDGKIDSNDNYIQLLSNIRKAQNGTKLSGADIKSLDTLIGNMTAQGVFSTEVANHYRKQIRSADPQVAKETLQAMTFHVEFYNKHGKENADNICKACKVCGI